MNDKLTEQQKAARDDFYEEAVKLFARMTPIPYPQEVEKTATYEMALQELASYLRMKHAQAFHAGIESERREIVEMIPSAFNPANAIMDDNRIGQNSMRKKILEAITARATDNSTGV